MPYCKTVSNTVKNVTIMELLPDKANQNTVSGDEAWCITSEVDIGSDDASAVTSHDLHGDPSTSLEAATNVSAVPC